eukprot:4870954-Alexandrium_andersonii.AAC.1
MGCVSARKKYSDAGEGARPDTSLSKSPTPMGASAPWAAGGANDPAPCHTPAAPPPGGPETAPTLTSWSAGPP